MTSARTVRPGLLVTDLVLKQDEEFAVVRGRLTYHFNSGYSAQALRRSR